MNPTMNSRNHFIFGGLVVCLIIFSSHANAQEEKTVEKVKRDDYKNSIKLNVSSQIIYENTFIMGFERVFKNHQALNISGGYVEFPLSLKLPETIELNSHRKKSGYTLEADWRFYLQKENRNAPPHGVYLAPFITLHHFKNDRDGVYTDSLGNQKNAKINSSIEFFTIGGQLGYQFVIKRRFVIDAVLLGPAITNYRFKVKSEGNLSQADREDIAEKIIEALREKLPLLDELAAKGEVSGSGVERFWSVGFRYNISIGYRF